MTVVNVPEKGSFEWSVSDLAGKPCCAVWFIGCFLPSSKEQKRGFHDLLTPRVVGMEPNVCLPFKTNFLYYPCCEFVVFVGVAETSTAVISTAVGIDVMNPSSREELDELQTAISKKIQLYAKSPHFPAFAEDLIRNICVNCKYANKK